jgi:hypothetical protein
MVIFNSYVKLPEGIYCIFTMVEYLERKSSNIVGTNDAQVMVITLITPMYPCDDGDMPAQMSGTAPPAIEYD